MSQRVTRITGRKELSLGEYCGFQVPVLIAYSVCLEKPHLCLAPSTWFIHGRRLLQEIYIKDSYWWYKELVFVQAIGVQMTVSLIYLNYYKRDDLMRVATEEEKICCRVRNYRGFMLGKSSQSNQNRVQI